MTKSIKVPRFGGLTLEELDKRWTYLKGGFAVKQPEVYGQVGLFRAVFCGRVVYIGCSEEMDKRLQQLRSTRELASNKHRGARKIRENIKDVELEVLLLGRGVKPKMYVAALKRAMLRQTCPEWNYESRNPRK